MRDPSASGEPELLCIAGRGGVGKSAVATEASSQLKHANVAHCRIDGDWLDLAFPQAPSTLFDANFRALWRNYRAHGRRRLIYSNFAAITNLDRLVRLMGESPRVTAVLLLADDATVVERLRSRESGADLQWHLDNLDATPASQRTMDALTPAFAVRIETVGRTVTDIAADVLAATGWLTSSI